MRAPFVSLLAWSLAAIATSAAAQDAASPPTPEATPKPVSHSGAPLFQFGMGPFVVTPTFRIGTLGVDTNVRYSRDRQVDFVASAGPGLDVSLPFHDSWKVNVESSAQYMYFQRTVQLRRWTWEGTSGLFWQNTGTEASVVAGIHRDFSRPSFEVDQRIARTTRSLDGTVSRDLGRLTMRFGGNGTVTRVDEGQEFRGADVSTSLATDRVGGTLQFELSVTAVSALLFEGGYEETHFPKATIRNYAQEYAGLGIKTDGYFTGQVTAGARRTHLLGLPLSRTRPYLRGFMSQQLGPRFKLAERYTHESNASAFAVDGTLPTYENRTLDADLSIQLTQRIDMKVGGTRTRLLSEGLVQILDDAGKVVKAERDDVVYVARAEFGLRLGRTRTVAFVSYTTRDSQYFADFGIQGVQAGARVEYAPQR